MSDFVGCTNYYNCQNIQDSQYIVNSQNVDSSSFVHESIDVSHCSDIYRCEDVTNSSQIFDSQFIYDSIKTFNVTNAVKSANVLTSTRVYNSTNIYVCSDINSCGELRNCDKMETSYFCANSKNLKNCIFCHDLEDKEYHIFNKPVSKEMYDIVLAQYMRQTKDMELDYLREQWPENMLIPSLPNPFIYHNKHYLQINDKFWRWARSVPGYDSDLLFRITLNFDLI